MNFHREQRSIQKNVLLLILIFCLAILANSVIGYVFIHFSISPAKAAHVASLLNFHDPIQRKIFVASFTLTLLLIFGASLYQFLQLSSSGDYLAQSLGAESIAPDTNETSERRLVNVVEEMSIASGVPVPIIFVLKGQSGINAFVSGTSPQNAVVCVTQGCLEQFNRDELQAVVAHEYSHLLNNDMALNHKVIAYLSGLLVLREWGLRSLGRKKGTTLAIPLLLIGTFGYFFALLISRALSRQREFLADAFAVEFTRNPSALASALRKILWNSSGSMILHPKTASISHLLFADGNKHSWFSTHPSLKKRIQRLDPNFMWDDPPSSARPENLRAGFSTLPSSIHLSYAGAFIQSVPEGLLHACHDLRGAQIVIRTFFIGDHSNALTGYPDLVAQVRALGKTARLPLFHLCLPKIRSLPPKERERFHKQILDDIRADGRVSLEEWLFLALVEKSMSSASMPSILYRRVDDLGEPISCLFSALDGISRDVSSEDALKQASAVLRASFKIVLAPCSVEALHRAVKKLSSASDSIRRDLLESMLEFILHDRIVSIDEIEFLRVIAAVFDQPVPPIPPDKLPYLTFR